MTCDEDMLCGINRAKSDEASDIEKKHTPVMTAPDNVKKGEPFDVGIEVGKLLAHPNEYGHFIQWIELYSGDTFLTRVELTPVLSSPRITVTVALNHSHPLRALLHCNLHGTWEGTKDITVG